MAVGRSVGGGGWGQSSVEPKTERLTFFEPVLVVMKINRNHCTTILDASRSVGEFMRFAIVVARRQAPLHYAYV